MEKFHYKIKSKLQEAISAVNKIVEDIKKAGIKEEPLFALRLSIEEAVVNAIRHGNKSNGSLYVNVECRIFEDKVEVDVEDQGPGFNYQDLPDPTHQENVYKYSGRGVYLIKKLMDKAEFLEGGRKLAMVKLLN